MKFMVLAIVSLFAVLSPSTAEAGCRCGKSFISELKTCHKTPCECPKCDYAGCAERVAPLVALAARPDFGRWKIERKTDPMSDVQTVSAVLSGSSIPGRKPSRPSIQLFCSRNSYVQTWLWVGQIVDHEARAVGFRFDRTPGDTWPVIPADGGDESFSFQDEGDLADDLSGHPASKLLVAIPLWRRGDALSTFKLHGIQAALAVVKASCKSK